MSTKYHIHRFSLILHLLLLLALSACGITTLAPSPMPSPTATPSRLPDPDEVKALLARAVDEEKGAPGIVVGMIADDLQERWVVGYGRLSADDERVPDGDTVFEIGSITKVFTGILLAQAVLNGEVKLDDPISMYLPERVAAPEYEGKPITLLDLATHTSGLPRMPSNFHPKDPNNPYADYTMDQMYDFLSAARASAMSGSNCVNSFRSRSAADNTSTEVHCEERRDLGSGIAGWKPSWIASRRGLRLGGLRHNPWQ